MNNVFAPGILVSVAFCSLMWGYLTFRNIADLRWWFSLACGFSSIGYLIAIYQYISIFYIHKVQQHDSDMWALFIRMLCHCTTVLIFVYHYKLSKKRYQS